MKAESIRRAIKHLRRLSTQFPVVVLMAKHAAWGSQILSFPKPVLVAVIGELDNEYLGWFVGENDRYNVRFPKDTTRIPTVLEKEEFGITEDLQIA